MFVLRERGEGGGVGEEGGVGRARKGRRWNGRGEGEGRYFSCWRAMVFSILDIVEECVRLLVEGKRWLRADGWYLLRS